MATFTNVAYADLHLLRGFYDECLELRLGNTAVGIQIGGDPADRHVFATARHSLGKLATSTCYMQRRSADTAYANQSTSALDPILNTWSRLHEGQFCLF
jgi:hypothetical protein